MSRVAIAFPRQRKGLVYGFLLPRIPGFHAMSVGEAYGLPGFGPEAFSSYLMKTYWTFREELE
jgi:hypothetical protein